LPETPDLALAALQALTPRERAKLAAILARLASPHAGERAAAGLLASAFVAKRGLAWVDLAALLQPVPASSVTQREPPPRQERRRGCGKPWRGFCRRRRVRPGQAMDHLT
jgi:hypothetical protein